MPMSASRLAYIPMMIMFTMVGCRGTQSVSRVESTPVAPAAEISLTQTSVSKSDTSLPENDQPDVTTSDHGNLIKTTAFQSQTEEQSTSSSSENETSAEVDRDSLNPYEEILAADHKTGSGQLLSLDDVIGSVYASYPLLAAADLQRNIAFGDRVAASGEFDTKVKASSANQPIGFYKTYRQTVGAYLPLYNGGELYSQYRIGRGSFEPWYGERETNDGGEFKIGFEKPLLRNLEIDPRRAELWQSGIRQQAVEPDIQAQRIEFVLASSQAYWDWVSAGHAYQIKLVLLKLAQDRNDQISQEVLRGKKDPPVEQDNLRIIAARQAELIDAELKLQKSAIKLSQYYRDFNGQPVIATQDQLPDFPEAQALAESQLPVDVQVALSRRPELAALDYAKKELDIDYALATNDLQPTLNVQSFGSQDVGDPSSSKRDKSRYEMEMGLTFDMPLQRRKAKGKITMVEAKMAQISAKRQITGDKIAIDVQQAITAINAAAKIIEQEEKSVQLATYMAQVERRIFAVGRTDLFTLNRREEDAVKAAITLVEAKHRYFLARADYRAALALD